MIINNKEIEKYREILAKHGHGNLSDEEVFEIVKNTNQLADVILNFENKSQKNKANRKVSLSKKLLHDE